MENKIFFSAESTATFLQNDKATRKHYPFAAAMVNAYLGTNYKWREGNVEEDAIHGADIVLEDGTPRGIRISVRIRSPYKKERTFTLRKAELTKVATIGYDFMFYGYRTPDDTAVFSHFILGCREMANVLATRPLAEYCMGKTNTQVDEKKFLVWDLVKDPRPILAQHYSTTFYQEPPVDKKLLREAMRH